MTKSISSTILLGAALLLASCAQTDGITPQVSSINETGLDVVTPKDEATQNAWPDQAWWKAYGDEQLNRWIDRALLNSPSLAIARARIAKAQASIQSAQAMHLPEVSADVNISRDRLSKNYEFPPPPLGPGGTTVNQGEASLNLDYELDIWGKNTSLINAQEAGYQAVVFDHDAAKLMLTTTLVRTYAKLEWQYQQRDILQAMIRQRKNLQALTVQRVAAGLDSQIELKAAQGRVAGALEQVAQLDADIEVTRLEIAALAGAMPNEAKQIDRPHLSPVAFSIPDNLPLDLLSRRPELAAQRARILAEQAQVQAAKTEFYPNINLLALVGYQAIGLSQLFASDSAMSSVGPAVHIPIFSGGRLRANYAAHTADLDAAVAQYNQLLLDAVQDTAAQLTQIMHLGSEEINSQKALEAAQEAYQLNLARYHEGLISYLTVLSAEDQVLIQRLQVVSLQVQHFALQVALIRALGGGFSTSSKISSIHSGHTS